MEGKGIICVFHYVPLHSSTAGLQFGYFAGVDKYTTKESERLVRLPMYYNISMEHVKHIINETYNFFREYN